jgi:tripartite-type tricarboxylate transporter receptor subunit TctC
MLRSLRLALGIAALALLGSGTASAQYPTRPVRLVVGFAPGGPTDIFARRLAQTLSERLGQQVIVENKPGATGNIATEYVINQPPDGHTLLVAATSNAINMTFHTKLSFSFLRDVAPVAGLARINYIVALNPSVPAKTVEEFVAYAKANPDKINFASGGIGSSSQLSTEMFKVLTGTKLVHVPYRGNAAAYADVISGQVQLIFADVGSVRPLIQSGALRGIAVTSAKRMPGFPDMPTVAETVPGYEAYAWYGFVAPKGTPAEVVERLNREINASLNDAQLRAHFATLEGEPMVFSVAEFTKFIATEADRWGEAVKASGVRAD